MEWDGNLPCFTSQHLVIDGGARNHTLTMTSPEGVHVARAVLAANFQEGDHSPANLHQVGELSQYGTAVAQFIRHMTYTDTRIAGCQPAWEPDE